MPYGVFISYSHEDATYVSPIVKLVRAMRNDLVFQDTVDIVPGKKWEPQLQNALEEAGVLIIFWCKHAAESPYVKKEYETAIEKNKDILPLLLDDSRLAEPLTAYQWIDLREVIFHKDEVARTTPLPRQMEFPPASAPPPPSAPPKQGKVLFMYRIAAAVVVVLFSLFFFTYNQTSYERSPASFDNKDSMDTTGIAIEQPTTSLSHRESTGWIWLAGGMLVIGVAAFAWVKSRRKISNRAEVNVGKATTAPKVQASDEIIAAKLLAALNEKMPLG